MQVVFPGSSKPPYRIRIYVENNVENRGWDHTVDISYNYADASVNYFVADNNPVCITDVSNNNTPFNKELLIDNLEWLPFGGTDNYSNLIYTSPMKIQNQLNVENSLLQGTGDASNNSVAIGDGTIATGNFSMSQGLNTSATGDYSHAEGGGTTAVGTHSHAEGQNTNANGNYSHAEGVGTNAPGSYCHAEGWDTTANGMASHAEGQGTQAQQNASHAEGFQTVAATLYSHAEGQGTQVVGLGQAGHAEGSDTTVGNFGSHAEGKGTQAMSNCCHAEGENSLANEAFSHAEGQDTSANGLGSHTEGRETYTAPGASNAHAEGTQTQALGVSSHAEGSQTIADDFHAHATGEGTRIKTRGGTSMGRWNDLSQNMLLVVGDGVNDASRSDAFHIDTSGNTTVHNKLFIDGINQQNILRSEFLSSNPGPGTGTGYYLIATVDNLKTINSNKPNMAELLTQAVFSFFTRGT